MTRRQQVGADAGAADGHDADLLLVCVAQLGAQLGAIAQVRGIKAGDVAGEVIVALGPVADHRQPGPEALGDDVIGVAHEQREVADLGVLGDVFDPLGVEVGGQETFPRVPTVHRQEPDEIAQPHVRHPLLAGVLVQVVVELPCLVADPEVIALLAHDVVEDHEVRGEDLVHAANGLEGVQVVLGGLRLDVLGLAGQMSAGGVDALALCLEHSGDGVLGEPVDLQVRLQAAQLAGDRHVALGVAEPDRR